MRQGDETVRGNKFSANKSFSLEGFIIENLDSGESEWSKFCYCKLDTVQLNPIIAFENQDL